MTAAYDVAAALGAAISTALDDADLTADLRVFVGGGGAPTVQVIATPERTPEAVEKIFVALVAAKIPHVKRSRWGAVVYDETIGA